MKAKTPIHRRLSHRSVLPTLLIAGILLPFLFIRAAFLSLDAGATICPSISCLGRRIGPLLFGDADTSQDLAKELRRAYIGTNDRDEPIDPKHIDSAPESIDHLLAEITSAASSYKEVDIKTFVLKTKAMLVKKENEVHLAKLRASKYHHLASIGIPKSSHCLSLRLSEEYLVNALARSSLPPPEYAYRLTNSSFIHIAILSDNVLATNVAVSSTVASSADSEKLVFHIVTDKKTYTAMHAWFALNPVFPAIVEVKGLHQFDWPPHVNATIVETVEEIHRSLVAHRRGKGEGEDYRRIESLSLSSFSVLNYLKIHLPELFPKLEKVIHLDDDIVVQHDLSPLWDLNLNGNVNGAVGLQEGNNNYCTGKKLVHYFNFSNPSFPLLYPQFEKNQCAWLPGMNIFNLKAWRWTNISQKFQQMLRVNRESGFVLWRPGWLPQALIAFDGKVQPIDPFWHMSELGRCNLKPGTLKSAAVVHFSGPRKPWLEIGFPELRKMWRAHLNHSNELLRSCRVV